MNPERKAKPARAMAYGAFAAVFLMLGIWSCDLSESKEGRNFISLSLPDSLKTYDSIRIVILAPGSADTLDTLWHGRPLGDGAGLKKLPTRRYPGGNVDVIIQGSLGGIEVYRSRVEFRGPGAETVTIDLTIDSRDRVPPVLSIRGLDSLVAYQGSEFSDPGADCTDDRDSLPILSATGMPDTRNRGWYGLAYECRDRAGNLAGKVRWIHVVRVPDSIPPIIGLSGPDTAVALENQAYADSGAICLDERDGALPVTFSGSINTGRRGLQSLAYHCADSAGNASDTVRWVLVKRRADAVKPVLTLRGVDTAVVYDRRPYVDSGAACLDDRDGTRPVSVTGAVDTGARGLYELAYHCADSSGNEAEARRYVRVTRMPDAVKPVITLRGADSLQVPQGQAYADLGADCADDRDGALPVAVIGSIDTALRTLQALAYVCADSAGNAAVTRTRKVNVVRAQDSVKPVITLRGPDSLQIFQGQAYVDSGAVCADHRDGIMPVSVTGAVNTAIRTLQTLTFHCADSAGNAAEAKTRKINVARVPDNVKPVVALRGERNLQSVLGAAYTDAGADCLDDRDGILPVTVKGAVNIAKVGVYVLTFDCADSAGNAGSPAPTRSVSVVANIDSLPPVITRAGPDTLVAVSSDAVFDPWATCLDAVDGPLTVRRTELPAVAFKGHFQVTYSCQDAAMNVATVTRIVKIGLFGTYLPAIAEGQMDTLDVLYNTGGSGCTGFVKEPGGKYFTLTRFDLSKVVKSGLKSAKLRFFTFGHGARWPGTQSDGKGGFGTFANYTFRVYTVKSDWAEGTGNWFYHDGGFRNSGDVWYQHYPLSSAVMAASTNPEVPSGITGADRSLVRASNIVPASTRTVNLFYGNWNGNPEQVPPPQKLTVLELDVTDYVKTADPAGDYGFLIKVDGTTPGHYIGFTTKELGDGSYAPRLMLEY